MMRPRLPPSQHHAGYEILEPLHQTAQTACAACVEQCGSAGNLGRFWKRLHSRKMWIEGKLIASLTMLTCRGKPWLLLICAWRVLLKILGSPTAGTLFGWHPYAWGTGYEMAQDALCPFAVCRDVREAFGARPPRARPETVKDILQRVLNLPLGSRILILFWVKSIWHGNKNQQDQKRVER